jgi:hypothetical protein
MASDISRRSVDKVGVSEESRMCYDYNHLWIRHRYDSLIRDWMLVREPANFSTLSHIIFLLSGSYQAQNNDGVDTRIVERPLATSTEQEQ